MEDPPYPLLKRMTAIHKVMICVLLAVMVFIIASFSEIDLLSRMMTSWNMFSMALLSIDWFNFFHTESTQIRTQARVEDNSRITIFGIILISTAASLLAVTLLLLSSDESHKVFHIVVAITGMALSWALVHTIFAVRYAHIYYGDHETRENSNAGGLDFPQEASQKNDNPDFIDFAYFAFTIGMTFQVSDVQINSKRLRRLTLMHGIISFVFNTVIVALTINTLAGLSK